MTQVHKRANYSFKEGLTMMAAKAVGIDPFLAAEAGEGAKAAINAIRHATKIKNAKEREALIRQAQTELRNINAAKHPQVVNAIQARLLALQGRGGDTEIAHVTPGEVVIPCQLQTPELMKRIAELAERQGIDPRQLTVGDRINRLNPRTGQKEFQFQPPIPTLPPGGLNDDLPPGTYVDPSDPNHIIVVTPRNSNGDGGTVGTGQGNGGGQGPVNVSGSGGGFRLRTGGGNPSDFGPAPADWGSRNDPFGVFRGYNNQGTPMGRSFVKYQEDVGFIDRQNDYMRSIGINPDNITADDHERFYQAANTGVFDPFKPAYWVN